MENLKIIKTNKLFIKNNDSLTKMKETLVIYPKKNFLNNTVSKNNPFKLSKFLYHVSIFILFIIASYSLMVLFTIIYHLIKFNV